MAGTTVYKKVPMGTVKVKKQPIGTKTGLQKGQRPTYTPGKGVISDPVRRNKGKAPSRGKLQ